MENWTYKVLGIMSGTSIDGIDLAIVEFKLTRKWNYELLKAETSAYTPYWKEKLKEAVEFKDEALQKLNQEYTAHLAEVILDFKRNNPNEFEGIDAVCSHGHTIKHEPENGLTLQIGNLPELAQLIGMQVVCDFRVQDVALGGQGAPLVPIGDEFLFPEYDYCLNLGGFANVSMKTNGARIAYDICPVNTVLNFYAEKFGFDFDENGKIAESGSLNETLLQKLNNQTFYFQKPPKSLGIEWVKKEIFPVLKIYENEIPVILHTFCIHIAQQITNSLQTSSDERILITGGGAYNDFLISKISEKTKADLVSPQKELIDYKEAVIFGFLGVLRLRNEINVLKSVTGAVKDHSSGKIFHP